MNASVGAYYTKQVQELRDLINGRLGEGEYTGPITDPDVREKARTKLLDLEQAGLDAMRATEQADAIIECLRKKIATFTT